MRCTNCGGDLVFQGGEWKCAPKCYIGHRADLWAQGEYAELDESHLRYVWAYGLALTRVYTVPPGFTAAQCREHDRRVQDIKPCAGCAICLGRRCYREA